MSRQPNSGVLNSSAPFHERLNQVSKHRGHSNQKAHCDNVKRVHIPKEQNPCLIQHHEQATSQSAKQNSSKHSFPGLGRRKGWHKLGLAEFLADHECSVVSVDGGGEPKQVNEVMLLVEVGTG